MTEPLLTQLGPAACRSYLLACPRTKQALIVDPLAEGVANVLEQLDAEGLRLAAVADTHTHADHLSGGRRLAQETGAPYSVHEATEAAGVGERLRDGAAIEVGDLRVEVLHTPGHTPDSVTLRCGRLLFTGDFLFLAQDGAGRLDLPGGDPSAHWESLRRLAAIEDDAVVLPGHDYEGFAASPLGEERRRNPRFQNLTREEYVAWQRAVAMPTPAWMLDVIAANLGKSEPHGSHHGAAPLADLAAACEGGTGACQAGPLGRVPMVTVGEAAKRMGAVEAARPFLLDVRQPHEYRGPMGRHAPGAVLVPLDTLPSRLAALPTDREREVLVICKSGGRSARATEFLIDRGFRRVFNVAGGTDAWAASGLPVER